MQIIFIIQVLPYKPYFPYKRYPVVDSRQLLIVKERHIPAEAE